MLLNPVYFKSCDTCVSLESSRELPGRYSTNLIPDIPKNKSEPMMHSIRVESMRI